MTKITSRIASIASALPLMAPDSDKSRVELDYGYDLRTRPWERSTAMHRLYAQLQGAEEVAGELLRGFRAYLPQFRRIARKEGPEVAGRDPRWINGWFPALDAITLYGLLAMENPRLYVEVGSGNSTRFARRAIEDHGLRTKIVSIDPQPRAEIDAICDEVVRQRLEDLDPARFDELSREDLLFVDCSHRSFQGSDVTVFFLEFLPALPDGTIYGIHDIWLPKDYPPDWRERYYNEQYLLASYLFGGADGDRILLPNAFLSFFSEHLHLFDDFWDDPDFAGIERGGGCFWMLRGGKRLPAQEPQQA